MLWLRSQADQVRLVQDSYYDDPLIEAAMRYHQSSEWQEISKILSENKGCALDVGAGRGIASYALARDGFKVTSLEPDSSDIVGAGAIRHLAEESRLPISTVEEYSEQLPFAGSEFDVVFARAVLHHMNNLDTGCREIARVLKPGGIFVAVREHVISHHEDLPDFLNSHPLHNLYGGENAYMLAQYRNALEGAGLCIVCQLSPLSSPINYFPQTKESLRQELVIRVKRAPGLGFILDRALRLNALFNMVFRLLALIDHRPGRLYSFVCKKPE